MYEEASRVEQKVEQGHLILQPVSALRSFILIPIITRAIVSVRILAATESNRSIPIRPTIPRYVGHVHVNANARERAVGVQCGRTW